MQGIIKNAFKSVPYHIASCVMVLLCAWEYEKVTKAMLFYCKWVSIGDWQHTWKIYIISHRNMGAVYIAN